MRLQERLPSDEEIIDVEGDMFQFGTDEWRIRASSLIDGGQIGSSQINYYIRIYILLRIPRRTLTHTHTLTHAYACAHTNTHANTHIIVHINTYLVIMEYNLF